MDSNIRDVSYQGQLDWIEKQFAEAEEEAKKCRHGDALLWRIVVGHAPLLSAGKSHGSNLRLQEELYPLFHRHGVHAYFNGHDHALQHLYGANHKRGGPALNKIANASAKLAAKLKTHFFVSGAGGGAYLQDIKRNAFLVHAEKALGFMAVSLTTHGNATDHVMHVSFQSEHAKEMYRAVVPHFN